MKTFEFVGFLKSVARCERFVKATEQIKVIFSNKIYKLSDHSVYLKER